MDIFKTWVFFPGNEEYLIDTIFYKDNWWIVGSWHESRTTKERTPKRLILLGGPSANYQEVNQPEYRFQLSNSIPKSVLDGKEQGDYVVVDFSEPSDNQEPHSVH